MPLAAPSRVIAGSTPLIKWSLSRIPDDNPIEQVIILLDWMPKKSASQPAGTVGSNVQYCDDWYHKPWEAKEKAEAEMKARGEKWKSGTDSTFTNLFWSWPRPLLETRRCLVMNAVWGVRKPDVEEFLSRTIELAKQIVCRRIIDWAKPKWIYVCGSKLHGYFSEPRVREICHPSCREWLFQLAAIETRRTMT
jgi:hypothetical protein